MKSKILFLDLSTKSTGWCVAIDGTLKEYGCITAYSTDVINRIYKIKNEVVEIIKKYDIRRIVCEEVRRDGTNSHTGKVLMWLQAAIAFAAHDIDEYITVEYLEVSTWRSKINLKIGPGVKRDNLKEQSKNYVLNKYEIDANDDVCDSICMMDAYFVKNKEPDVIYFGQ